MELLGNYAIAFSRVNSEYVFHFPSSANSEPNDRSLYTCFARPFVEALRFSIKFYKAIREHILLLFPNGGPAAIRRLVVSLFIWEPIERPSFWPFSHIAQEVRELLPSFADSHAFCSIMRKFRVFGISAALKHGCPSIVGWRSSYDCVMSMFHLTVGHEIIIPVQRK